jgi:hypothetical protein
MTMNTTTNRNSLDPRPHRAVTQRIVMRAVLLLALLAATVALTQCQMVSDKLTGVQASVFKRKNDCIKHCQKDMKDAERDEKKKHKDLERACGGNSACLSEEKARHEAAVEAIEAAYRDCINNCHSQGGDDGDGHGHGHDD